MDEEKEFERITDSIDRYQSMSDDEVEDDEFDRLFSRWEELRRKGHGPQPHHLDDA